MATREAGRTGPRTSVKVQNVAADRYVERSLSDLQRNLAFIRERRRMTYNELAIRTGITQSNAFFIVKGQAHPNYTTLLRLAHALDVEVGLLVGDPPTFRERYDAARELPALRLVLDRSYGAMHIDADSYEAMREYVDTGLDLRFEAPKISPSESESVA